MQGNHKNKYSIAVNFFNAGRFQESEELLKKLIEKKQIDPKILNLMGGIYMNTQRNKLAYKTFKKVLKIDPKNITVVKNLVTLLKRLENFEEVNKYLIILSSLTNNDLSTRLELVNNLISLNRKEEAFNLIEKIEEKEENSEIVATTKANCLLLLKRYEESKKIYEKVYSNNRENYQALFRLGYFNLEDGKNEMAISFFSKILQIKEKVKSQSEIGVIYYNIGLAYERLKKYDQAEESYLLSLKYKVNEVDVYANLSNNYVKKNDLDKAINYIKKAILIEPTKRILYMNMSIIYDKIGDHRKAIHYRRIASGSIIFKPKEEDGLYELNIEEL